MQTYQIDLDLLLEAEERYTYEGNSSNRVVALCYKETDKIDYHIVGYCSNYSNSRIIPDNSSKFSDKTGGTTR